MLSMRPLLAIATFLILWPACAAGQNAKDSRAKSAPARSGGITSDQAQAILDELRQIRELLEKQQKPGPTPAPAAPAPPRPTHAAVKLDGSFAWLGKADAPITVVEFTDYECPFCRQFHLTTFHDLRKNYVDTGKIRFVTVDLPLDMHSNAHRAAVAARCAGEQNQFWAMREALISNGNRLAGDTIPEIARSLYMDGAAFQTCLDSGKYEDAIRATTQLSTSLGITGTPTFLIGPTTESGVDGDIVVGALPYADFEALLKKIEVK